MPIMHDYIKGAGKTGSQWTYIEWIDTADKITELKADYLPKIKVGNTNVSSLSDSSLKDYGHIITENGIQQINGNITFKGEVKLNSSTVLNSNLFWNRKDKSAQVILQCSSTSNSNFPFVFDDANTEKLAIISVKSSKNSSHLIACTNAGNCFIGFNGTDGVNLGWLQVGKPVPSITRKAGSIYVGDEVIANGIIKSKSKVEAQYFNATSDKRAKTNIQQANFNALDIVKDLPIYTFNYKNSDSPSIGLIAQEAKEIKFDNDFNLVDNLSASGENEDYMTLKESKLVYVLWKAVQEQQKEIELLKEEINTLKATNK